MQRCQKLLSRLSLLRHHKAPFSSTSRHASARVEPTRARTEHGEGGGRDQRKRDSSSSTGGSSRGRVPRHRPRPDYRFPHERAAATLEDDGRRPCGGYRLDKAAERGLMRILIHDRPARFEPISGIFDDDVRSNPAIDCYLPAPGEPQWKQLVLFLFLAAGSLGGGVRWGTWLLARVLLVVILWCCGLPAGWRGAVRRADRMWSIAEARGGQRLHVFWVEWG